MYLLFYDISQNNLRSKIARFLTEQGYERLQYSVFVGPYDPNFNKVWKTIAQWMKEAPDEKMYCLKITEQNFLNLKTIGILENKLEYLAGRQSSLIV